jgi:hypothetical protein
VEAAVARAARGAEVAGGRQRRREVVGSDQATAASTHVRGRPLAGTRGQGPVWALASGPRHFSDFLRFSIFQTLKFKTVTSPMSKIHQILHRIVGSTRNNFPFWHNFKFKRIASYKFWAKFKFESLLNFKGIQTFL